MRGIILKLAGVLAGSALVAATADAQTCLGRPFFSTGPVQVGAGANMSIEGHAVGADLTLGQDRSVFGRMGLARASQDRDGIGPSRAGTEFSATAGYQMNVSGPKRAQVCPYASYDERGLGADGFTPARTYSQSVTSVGASMGWVIPHRGSVHIVPFAGLGYARTSGTVSQTGAAQVHLAHDEYMPGTIGAGVHVADRWMVTGQAMVPFGAKDVNPVIRASVILPTGRYK